MPPLWEQLSSARVYDLGQPYFTGMPHYPSHPPFLFSLTKQHGDMVGPAGNSSAADAIALGSHVGTHIDALCHFSCGGKLHGGQAAEEVQSYGGGLKKFSVDTVAPILRRGVLLDRGGRIRRWRRISRSRAEHLEAARKAEIRRGDVVLLRTGWARYFEDARQVHERHAVPGPALAAAQWLSAQGIFAAGSDTVAFEKIAGGCDAGARAFAGGERDPHHRVPESGGTGGGRGEGVPVRGRCR